jgi:hypothetical protein
MFAQPGEQHRWLEQLLGEWTFEGVGDMGPDQPPHKSSGKETVRSLGGLWVICEGEMGDGAADYTVMTLGYDPAKSRYVGSWIGSMMTHMWVYEGEVDEAGTTLTLNTEGPDFADPTKIGRYRDVIAFNGDGERTLTSHALQADGSWRQFMKAVYRRVG